MEVKICPISSAVLWLQVSHVGGGGGGGGASNQKWLLIQQDWCQIK